MVDAFVFPGTQNHMCIDLDTDKYQENMEWDENMSLKYKCMKRYKLTIWWIEKLNGKPWYIVL